jgi:DNA polymerase-1
VLRVHNGLGGGPLSSAAVDPKLWVFDGTASLLRAWFAGVPGTNVQGRPNGALGTAFRGLWRFLEERKIQRVAVVFDRSIGGFRKEIDPNYKANRVPPPEELAWELRTFEEVLQAAGIAVWGNERFEADDLTASLVTRARSVGVEVVVASEDKDLLQLVRDTRPQVRCFSPSKGLFYGYEEVVARMGVPPEQVGDLLALAGDSSDGIRGLAGVGPKTAAGLLANGRRLSELLENPDLAAESTVRGAKRLPERLRQGADEVRLAMRLVRLEDAIELPAGLWDATQRGVPNATAPIWKEAGLKAPGSIFAGPTPRAS